eukprot:6439492-Alexandrium_andersonii.AAC.1
MPAQWVELEWPEDDVPIHDAVAYNWPLTDASIAAAQWREGCNIPSNPGHWWLRDSLGEMINRTLEANGPTFEMLCRT